MVASAAKREGQISDRFEVPRFIWGKIKGYMPYWVIFWLLDFFVRYGKGSFGEIVRRFINCVWSMFFLNMAGIGSSVLGMGWYIQCMLLVMLILYPICLKSKKHYCEVIAPVAAILTIAYFSKEQGTLSRVSQWKTFFYSGTLRLFGSISLGGFIYFVSNAIRGLKLTKLERVIVTIAENAGLIVAILIIDRKWNSNYDFLVLLLFFVCLTLQFSGLGYSNRIFSGKWLKYAGLYSLLVYLASNVIKDVLTTKKWELGYWRMTLIYLLLTVLLAFTVDMACRLMRRTRHGKKKCAN